MESQELVFANDLCSAFLATIVKEFQTQYPSTTLGRTAMQKLTYFSKVLGAPIPCSFGIYTFGPYSDKVTFSIDSMLADEVIVDESSNPGKSSSYRLGRNADELLTAFADELRPHEPKIARTVMALGLFQANDLELISTLHFIAKKQLRTRKDRERATIIDEFKSIKRNKFDDGEINTWYEALAKAGLIDPQPVSIEASYRTAYIIWPALLACLFDEVVGVELLLQELDRSRLSQTANDVLVGEGASERLGLGKR